MAAGGATRTAEETHAALDREAEARYSDPRRWQVFAVTWVSYASYYLARKNVSVTKTDLEREHGITRIELGTIDVSYLAAYALGQFLWGYLADKLGPRRVLAAGMLATAGITSVFGMSSQLGVFVLVWGLNGLAQGTGWSSNVKAMTAWFSPRNRGPLMGVWSTCYQVGSLVSGPIAVACLGLLAMGWPGAFFGPAAIVATLGIGVFLLLPEAKTTVVASGDRADRSQARRDARSRVIRTPLVWGLGASYFFMKLTRYALFFWLIYFMEKELDYTKGSATNTALAFEVGGTMGSIAIGTLSQRIFSGRRLGIGITCLVLLAAALPLYGLASYSGHWANMGALALVGFLLYGPDTLLSATAAQDLGGPQAAATASGFINGVGSIGPVVGTLLAADLTKRLGWAGFYTLLGAGSLVSAAILAPFWWKQRRAG